MSFLIVIGSMRCLDLPTPILLASEACVLVGWMEESTRVLPLKVGLRMEEEEMRKCDG